jgi:hypothetical protein
LQSVPYVVSDVLANPEKVRRILGATVFGLPDSLQMSSCLVREAIAGELDLDATRNEIYGTTYDTIV